MTIKALVKIPPSGSYRYKGVRLISYRRISIILFSIESLRLHPPFTLITKKCTEDCELDYAKGKRIFIEKGPNVYQMQRDAECYPDPNHFIPERFGSNNEKFVKGNPKQLYFKIDN